MKQCLFREAVCQSVRRGHGGTPSPPLLPRPKGGSSAAAAAAAAADADADAATPPTLDGSGVPRQKYFFPPKSEISTAAGGCVCCAHGYYGGDTFYTESRHLGNSFFVPSQTYFVLLRSTLRRIPTYLEAATQFRPSNTRSDYARRNPLRQLARSNGKYTPYHTIHKREGETRLRKDELFP